MAAAVSTRNTKTDRLGAGGWSHGSITAEIVEAARVELARREAVALEASLADYTRAVWPIIEPGRDYLTNWHIDAIAEHLEAVYTGEITRLLINVPFRTSKSTVTSLAFPTWCWAKNPTLRFLTGSYAEKLATRDALRSRRVIQSKWYQDRWGDRFSLTGDQNEKKRYENDKTGNRIAFGMGAGVMGEGADHILLDDPHDRNSAHSDKERETELVNFDEAVSTRLNDPNKSSITVIMQRLHEKDLSGHVLESGDNRWVHLMLPMRYEKARHCVTVLGFQDPRKEEGELLWPERFSAEAVEGIEKTLGPYASAGQLQQSPSPKGGGLFRGESFRRFRHVKGEDRVTLYPTDAEPIQSRIVETFVTADTALSAKKSADFTVISTWAKLADGRGLALLDLDRKQTEAPETEQRLIASSNSAWAPKYVGVEDATAGRAFCDFLQRRGITVKRLKADTDKVSRSTVAQVMVESGQVWLPDAAPWAAGFISECEVFPNGRNDDQVDTLSYAAICVQKARGSFGKSTYTA